MIAGFFALYRKELRALWPMLALCTFVISGDFVFRPFTERLDENAFTDVALIAPGDGMMLGFFVAILAFMMAYASFPREHDEGTIEFLYALPITRRGIFLAKTAAGVTMLVSACVIGQVTNAILVSWNPSSFEGHQIGFRLAATAAMLHAVVAVALYGHGLFASFFRGFGLLPYAFVSYVLIVISEIFPEAAWLNPLRIARSEYVGADLVVPTFDIVFHLGISGLAAIVAYVLWMGSLDRVRAFFATRSTVFTVAFGCGAALMGFVGFIVMGFWAVSEYGSTPPEDPRVSHQVVETQFQTSEAHTTHYAFVYPDNVHDQTMALMSRADPLLEEVTRVVGEESAPSITVDLAEVSGHHEGITAGTRIRMGLFDGDTGGVQEPWRLVHVLAHESAHVLQGVTSAERLMEYAGTTRFFVEGGAEWIAFEALTGPHTVMTETELARERDLRAAQRLVAVTSWERQQMRFEDLLDNAGFTARWDTVLAYPLGETLSEAVRRACGDEAYGNVLRSFRRPEVPQDAEHEVLFRDALSSFGCDYERVAGAWDGLMVELVASERARIDAIPRMSGGVVGAEGNDVVIEATLDRAPLPVERYFVRVRSDALTADTEVRSTEGTIVEGSSPRRVRFRVPRSLVRGPRFELLFSLEIDPHAFPVSEAWQGAAAP